MSDARSLLKAKKQAAQAEHRIQHPFASYSAAGQLRCSLCGTTIKHPSPTTWKLHLDSKSHKVAVEKEEAARAKGKRKALDVPEITEDSRGSTPGEELTEETKRRKLDPPSGSNSPPPPAASGFPADFFSDRSRTLPEASYSDDSDAEGEPPSTNASGTTNNAAAIDDEFAAFEKAMAAVSTVDKPSKQHVYDRATVFAEPELVSTEEAGFPPSILGSAESKAISNGPKTTTRTATAKKDDDAVAPDTTDPPEETEAQIRKRREQEEKELIMDRLLEEERAQEEADDKVQSLKMKYEALKKQRAARKAAKEKASKE